MNWSFSRQGDAVGPALIAPTAAWLAEDFLESYVCWREESEAVRAAYEHWHDRPRPDRDLAFAAYRAALDREEHAALIFRQRVDRVRSAPN